MSQEVEQGMEAAQFWYKGDHDGRMRKARKEIDVGPHVNLYRPLMTTSTAKHLATKSYVKLPFVKIGPFCVIKVTSVTVKIDNDCISSTVPVNRASETPPAKKTKTEEHRTQNDEKDDEWEETYIEDTQM